VRVLLADHIGGVAEQLRARGHEVLESPALDADSLPAAVAGVDALVVRSTRVSAATIEAGSRLSLVLRAGAGTNTIDVEAAAAAGVYVCNVPGRNSVAVAELTLGLLLALDRRIVDNTVDLRAGRWDKTSYSQARGVLGRTLGVLGLGDIGSAVARRAAAFGMPLATLARPSRPAATTALVEQLGIREVDGLAALAAASDVLTVHVPATAATRGLVGAQVLAALPDGAFVLNTSRGDVVDEGALLAELDAGRLWAGLDVYPGEPAAGRTQWSSPLAAHPRVVGTHHIGASTEQAQQAVADGVVEVVDAFAHGDVRHCVNLAEGRLGSGTVVVRHRDRVGVLAGVFDLLRRAGVNIEQMDNRVFAGGTAAVATIDVAGQVDRELLARLDALPDVLHVSLLDVPATNGAAQ